MKVVLHVNTDSKKDTELCDAIKVVFESVGIRPVLCSKMGDNLEMTFKVDAK